MAIPEHVEIIKQGAAVIERWRSENPDVQINLSDASLLTVELEGANLRGSNLSGVNLTNADLKDADLSDCLFVEAWLNRVDLANANLASSNFCYCGIRGCNLKNTNFNGARFGGTAITAVDLSKTRGLANAIHYCSSSLGIDTVQQSKCQIPDEFLRGCGVDPRVQPIMLGDPKALEDATYDARTKRGSFRLQSCFISYSSRDKTFVERLRARLNDSGVDYWYAPKHGEWGRGLQEQIDQEISLRDRVIVVCSDSSLNHADWVKHEISKAIESEDKRKAERRNDWRVLFPIMLDDTLPTWNNHLRLRLQDALAGDFRKASKGQAFDRAFTRLLDGLRDVNERGGD